MNIQFVPVTVTRQIIEHISRLEGGDATTGEPPQVVVDTITRLVQETEMQAVQLPSEPEVSSLSEEDWQDEGHVNCLDFACTLLDELQAQGVDISEYEIVILESTEEGKPGHVGLMDADGNFYDAGGAHEDFEAWKAENGMREVTNADARVAGDDFLEIMSIPAGPERDAALAAAGLEGLADLEVAALPLLIFLALLALGLVACSPDEVELPTVEQARATLQNAPARATLDDMTPEERVSLYVVMREFVDRDVLQDHHAWHNRPENGSGGVSGPTSGERFLTFHRGLIRDAERYVGGGFTMPMWNTANAIPPELFDPVNDPLVADELNAALGFTTTGRNPQHQPFARPSWLTVAGGAPFVAPATGTANADIAGNTYQSLNDITSLDELGRLMGVYYHAIGHATIGGTMTSFGSPADPAFFAWHEHLDRIIDDWLATESGRQWLASQPNGTHPIVDSNLSMDSAP